jgi:hypothetical protein
MAAGCVVLELLAGLVNSSLNLPYSYQMSGLLLLDACPAPPCFNLVFLCDHVVLVAGVWGCEADLVVN